MGGIENTAAILLQIQRFNHKMKMETLGRHVLLQSVLSKGDRGYDYLTQTEVVSTAGETSSQNELNFVW